MHAQRLSMIDLGGEDPAVAMAVDAVRQHGIDVDRVAPEDAIQTLRSRPPVLAVVHTHRLTVDSLDLLRLLGNEGIPVVVLSDDLTEDAERILLHGGALVTIGLPVAPTLLQARLTSLYTHLRARPGGVAHEVLVVDDLTVDPRRRDVTVAGHGITLTKTEFGLLRTLARDPSAVVSRQRLMHDVDHGALKPRSLESHLSRLRLKITAAGGPRLIEPVRGVGYRLLPGASPQAG